MSFIYLHNCLKCVFCTIIIIHHEQKFVNKVNKKTNKKAKDILNWQPIKTIEKSIETAYSWEKCNKGNLSK